MLETLIPFDAPEPIFAGGSSDAVATCPDLETHLGWVSRADRAARDVGRLRRRLKRSTRDSTTAEFDRRRAVLSHHGYTDGWSLTPAGETLRRLYNELDLLLAEALAAGVLDTDDPGQFAALASIFTYETRGGDLPHPPQAAFAAAPIAAVYALWEQLTAIERGAGVAETREPDVGLVDTIYGWASGLGLDDIFDDEDVRAGDFVRAARQLLDLLRQIRDGYGAYRTVASAAIESIDRGIVASEVVR